MIDKNFLRSLIEKNNGILFDFKSDGFVVSNSSGEKLLHLPLEEFKFNDKIAIKVADFFEHNCNSSISNKSLLLSISNNNKIDDILSISLNISIEIFTTNIFVNSFLQLLNSLSSTYFVNIVIWFSSPPLSWQDILFSFRSLKNTSNVAITLVGSFSMITDIDKEFLFSQNIKLIHCQYSPQLKSDTPDVIKNLCKFGFRVPVFLFVTNENISFLQKHFNFWMDLNYNSGFALPLLIDSPFFHPNENFTYTLPNAREYILLLLDVFKQYPLYDEVLFPLSSFAARSFRGNWNDLFRVPKNIQFWFSHQHGIFLNLPY
jgi:hypothetical protein